MTNLTARVGRYSPAFLEEFRVIIVTKIEETKEILECLSEIIGLPSGEAYIAMKMYESSSEVNDQESVCDLASRLKSLLTKLEQALERINNGTYGICLKTGQLIEEERLRLVPHTEYCLAAKVQNPIFCQKSKKR